MGTSLHCIMWYVKEGTGEFPGLSKLRYPFSEKHKDIKSIIWVSYLLLEKISHFLEMDPDARNNAKSSLQGMRCPANTHKPSFHVNTSVTSKHNGSKGTSSGQKGGMPTPNMEENMTEEEFFEWLQNAVQAGMFDTCGGSTSAESPSAKAGNFSKSGGTNSGSGSGSKRKKKGKKPW